MTLFQGSIPETHCQEAPASREEIHSRLEPCVQCVPRLEPRNENWVSRCHRLPVHMLAEFLPIWFWELINVRDDVAIVLRVADQFALFSKILSVALAPSHRKLFSTAIGLHIELKITVSQLHPMNAFDSSQQVTAIQRRSDNRPSFFRPVVQRTDQTNFCLIALLIPCSTCKTPVEDSARSAFLQRRPIAESAAGSRP